MGSKENNYIERYWRDATPQDAIKEPPMVARFKYEESGKWKIELLLGFDRDGSEITWSGQSRRVKYCQVYDAPDPGEGWRLIDTKYEQPQEGDEFLLTPRNEWITIAEHPSRGFRGRGFAESYIYRRRIEQPKPEPKYVPFTWEDREQLRGRWVADVDGYEFLLVTLEWRSSGVIEMNGVDADSALEMWTFLDTNEPVGKRVD